VAEIVDARRCWERQLGRVAPNRVVVLRCSTPGRDNIALPGSAATRPGSGRPIGGGDARVLQRRTRARSNSRGTRGGPAARRPASAGRRPVAGAAREHGRNQDATAPPLSTERQDQRQDQHRDQGQDQRFYTENAAHGAYVGHSGPHEVGDVSVVAEASPLPSADEESWAAGIPVPAPALAGTLSPGLGPSSTVGTQANPLHLAAPAEMSSGGTSSTGVSRRDVALMDLLLVLAVETGRAVSMQCCGCFAPPCWPSAFEAQHPTEQRSVDAAKRNLRSAASAQQQRKALQSLSTGYIGNYSRDEWINFVRKQQCFSSHCSNCSFKDTLFLDHLRQTINAWLPGDSGLAAFKAAAGCSEDGALLGGDCGSAGDGVRDRVVLASSAGSVPRPKLRHVWADAARPHAIMPTRVGDGHFHRVEPW